jgi:hypothetical protein
MGAVVVLHKSQKEKGTVPFFANPEGTVPFFENGCAIREMDADEKGDSPLRQWPSEPAARRISGAATWVSSLR